MRPVLSDMFVCSQFQLALHSNQLSAPGWQIAQVTSVTHTHNAHRHTHTENIHPHVHTQASKRAVYLYIAHKQTDLNLKGVEKPHVPNAMSQLKQTCKPGPRRRMSRDQFKGQSSKVV